MELHGGADPTAGRIARQRGKLYYSGAIRRHRGESHGSGANHTTAGRIRQGNHDVELHRGEPHELELHWGEPHDVELHREHDVALHRGETHDLRRTTRFGTTQGRSTRLGPTSGEPHDVEHANHSELYTIFFCPKNTNHWWKNLVLLLLHAHGGWNA